MGGAGCEEHTLCGLMMFPLNEGSLNVQGLCENSRPQLLSGPPDSSSGSGIHVSHVFA